MPDVTSAACGCWSLPPADTSARADSAATNASRLLSPSGLLVVAHPRSALNLCFARHGDGCPNGGGGA